MSEIIEGSSGNSAEQKGTNVRRFLATRGLLVIKEFREIGVVKSEYGQRIKVSTLIMAVGKSAPRENTYGVRLETRDDEKNLQDTSFLDLDETGEFLEALEFIQTAAKRMTSHQRDYTELTYSTKDDVTFGFYQSAEEQQPFIKVGTGADTLFLSFEKLEVFKRAILQAREYLLRRGGEA